MKPNDPVPEGSIYHWMFVQGLKHRDLSELRATLEAAGKRIRESEDVKNYWNGYYRSDLYERSGYQSVVEFHRKGGGRLEYFGTPYSGYPDHPYTGMPEVENRWVPCSGNGKPMIKWSKACLSRIDAECRLDSASLAENLKGTKMIVVDCDGDHGDRLDAATVAFLAKYMPKTHTLAKPKLIKEYETFDPSDWQHVVAASLPASFHLTFSTDKVIPTMHFGFAAIDIIGNKENSLRYMKNKKWNSLDPAPMTDEIWEDIKAYIGSRKE